MAKVNLMNVTQLDSFDFERILAATDKASKDYPDWTRAECLESGFARVILALEAEAVTA